jgi:hypothetical protein
MYARKWLLPLSVYSVQQINHWRAVTQQQRLGLRNQPVKKYNCARNILPSRKSRAQIAAKQQLFLHNGETGL